MQATVYEISEYGVYDELMYVIYLFFPSFLDAQSDATVSEAPGWTRTGYINILPSYVLMFVGIYMFVKVTYGYLYLYLSRYLAPYRM